MLDHCGFINMSLGQVITMKHQLCIIIKPCPVMFMNIKIISSWTRKPISAVSCGPRPLVLSCSWNRTPVSVISCETRRAYECGYLVMLNLIIMHNWCFIVMTCPRDIFVESTIIQHYGDRCINWQKCHNSAFFDDFPFSLPCLEALKCAWNVFSCLQLFNKPKI